MKVRVVDSWSGGTVSLHQKWIAYTGNKHRSKVHVKVWRDLTTTFGDEVEVARAADHLYGNDVCTVQTESPVTAMKFGTSLERGFLVVATKRDISTWIITEGGVDQEALMVEINNLVEWIVLDSKEEWIAFGAGENVRVVGMNIGKSFVLSGHEGKVTGGVFVDTKSEFPLFFSVSEDRSFKVWDMSSRSCIHHSQIFRNILLSIAFDATIGRLAVGSDSGDIHIFDFIANSMSANKSLPRFNISRLTKLNLRKQFLRYTDDIEDCSSEDSSFGALTMIYNRRNLSVGMPSGITMISGDTLEPTSWTLFGEHEYPFPPELVAFPEINNGCSFEFSISENPSSLLACISDAFIGKNWMVELVEEVRNPSLESRKVKELVNSVVNRRVQGGWAQNHAADTLETLEQLGINEVRKLTKLGKNGGALLDELRDLVQDDEIDEEQKNLSMRKSESHLKTEFRSVVNGRKDGKARGIIDHKNGVLNMPITFRNSVKSSGYGDGPKVLQFFQRPKMNTKDNQKKILPLTQTRLYPLNRPIDQSLGVIDRHAGGIFCVRHSPDGVLLASTSSDRTIRIRSRISTNGRTVDIYRGHNGPVTSISWSTTTAQETPTFLTCSLDGTARMWSKTRADPILIFQRKNAHIEHGCFMSKNAYVATTTSNVLHLDKYTLQSQPRSSVKPMINYNQSKSVAGISLDCKSITSVATPNLFSTKLVLVGGSDRSIRILDFEAKRECALYTNAHSRSVGGLSIADYLTPPESIVNVFASSAIGDPIKIWDVRMKNAVMVLHGTVNKQVKKKQEFSPCGRYLAGGSEDYKAYIFDLRKAQVLRKLGVGTEVPVSLSWHPLKPVLVVGTSSGSLYAFHSTTTEPEPHLLARPPPSLPVAAERVA